VIEEDMASTEFWHATDDIITVGAILVTAAATVAMALFTKTLANVTGKSVDLAREEFISAHRPRLRIRGIQTDGLSMGTYIKVVNVGETTATITGVTGVLARRQGARWVPEGPDLSNPRPLLAPVESIVRAGEERGFGFFPNGYPNGDAPLFLVGLIKYVDALGTVRATGFAWFYDAVQNAFTHPHKTDKSYYELNYEFNYED
jgi:hypothetical protein